MIPISVADLAAVTGARLVPDTPQVRGLVVDGPVVTDSREAGPGSLYVARIGERRDGHDFVAAAAEAGAVAALTSRVVEPAADDPTAAAVPCLVVEDVQEAFVAIAAEVLRRGRAGAGLTVIGITGSSGKTTTKDLLAQVLATDAPTVANVGSLNSEVGVPLTVCRTAPDTAYLILEMGARGVGHIRYLTDMTHPEVGVVLNVGSAHVGVFGSRQTIAAAKAELVQALDPDGLAVLNDDDPLVAAMSGRTRASVIRFGRARGGGSTPATPRAQVWADDVRLDPRTGAPSFTLHAVGDSAPVDLALLGDHQVDNALAVAAVALYLGMGLPDVAAALGAATPTSRWRMECQDRPDGLRIVNDAYNANPESMAAALRTVAGMAPPGPAGRRWVALGEMLELGEDGPAQHAAMGELAARLGIDRVVAVGAGGAPVADGALAAGMPVDQVDCVPDVDAAYALLDAQLQPGDLVLVKSSRDSGLRVLGERLVAAASPATADREVGG